MIIYKITNTVNGKVYIGQTVQTLRKRRNGHLADSKRDRPGRAKSKIGRAINKYGIDSFSFEVLSAADTQAQLKYLEQHYITEYDSMNDSVGYNLLSGGHQNGRHSEETKRKIRESGRKNAARYWLGKHHSAESNAKRSETLKGKPCPARAHSYTDEQRAALSAKMKLVRSQRFWSTKKRQ